MRRHRARGGAATHSEMYDGSIGEKGRPLFV